MNLRLEQLAKWASLIALSVLLGALIFNINIEGENKMLPGGTVNPNSPAGQALIAGQTPIGDDGKMLPGMSVNPNSPFGQSLLAGQSGTTNTYTGPSQAEIYARQQAQAKAAADQRARDSFNAGRDILNSSVNQSISDRAQTFGRGIQDWVTGYNKSQGDLDNRGINANMAKQQGMQGIMQTVGQGIKSAGTMLGNRNAGSSSASQAIADAYGKVGQQQASQVGNQYELANNQINLEQQQLSDAAALYNRRIAEDKTSIVNGIVNEAQSKIAALNEAAANASITDRMDIAGEINRIKSQAQSQLQQYDGELGKIKQAQTLEQRQAEAQRLAQAGTAPTQQFQYTTQTPGQFQNTGDFASSMPLFTYGLNKNKFQA